MTNVSTFQQLRRSRARRLGLQSRSAPSGVTGASWWTEQNSRCSSGLAFMATPGLTRIETTHWTARYVVPSMLSQSDLFSSSFPFLIPSSSRTIPLAIPAASMIPWPSRPLASSRNMHEFWLPASGYGRTRHILLRHGASHPSESPLVASCRLTKGPTTIMYQE